MSVFAAIMSAVFSGDGFHADPAGAASIIALAVPRSSGRWHPVDVNSVMNRLGGRDKERLDWRTSIVDLMKALDLDSSLATRKELARELHYTGDMRDAAAMDVWLHKQVVTKLAQHGGKVPEHLLA